MLPSPNHFLRAPLSHLLVPLKLPQVSQLLAQLLTLRGKLPHVQLPHQMRLLSRNPSPKVHLSHLMVSLVPLPLESQAAPQTALMQQLRRRQHPVLLESQVLPLSPNPFLKVHLSHLTLSLAPQLLESQAAPQTPWMQQLHRRQHPVLLKSQVLHLSPNPFLKVHLCHLRVRLLPQRPVLLLTQRQVQLNPALQARPLVLQLEHRQESLQQAAQRELFPLRKAQLT